MTKKAIIYLAIKYFVKSIWLCLIYLAVVAYPSIIKFLDDHSLDQLLLLLGILAVSLFVGYLINVEIPECREKYAKQKAKTAPWEKLFK